MRRIVERIAHRIWRQQGSASDMLMPLAWLYERLSVRHMQKQEKHAWVAPIPVIVVGNLLPGGSGKTPVTLALCQFLQAADWQPGIVSRGYGVRIKRQQQAHCSSSDTSAAYLGDEPALLHRLTGVPLAVHPDRVQAAQTLINTHPQVNILLSDDGLQHRALARDIEIVVQDARGLGNGRLLPAGPLRESPERIFLADWLITQLAPGESMPEIFYAPIRHLPDDAQKKARYRAQAGLPYQQSKPVQAAGNEADDSAKRVAGDGNRPAAEARPIQEPNDAPVGAAASATSDGNRPAAEAKPLQEPNDAPAGAAAPPTGDGDGDGDDDDNRPAIESPAWPANERTLQMWLLPSTATHLASGREMPWEEWLAMHAGQRCSAIAGIGQPQRFFAMLRAQNLQLTHEIALADHARLGNSVLQSLPPQTILLTGKDAIKLQAPHDERLWAVSARAEFSNAYWMQTLHEQLIKLATQPKSPAASPT